jgi:hypothetical protein
MTQQRAVSLWISALVVVLGIDASAQTRRATTPRADPAPITIHRNLTASLAPGCSYHTRVTGTVQPVNVDKDTVGYRPDLRVQSWLDCASTSRRADTAQLRGGVLTRQGIERELERRSLIAVRHAETVCIIGPEFRFDGHQLGGNKLLALCGGGPRQSPPPAVGGGPQPSFDNVQHL